MPKATSTKMPVSKSEDSDDSSNTAFMASVVQQVQTTWEKKKKDQESRFLQNAADELKQCGAETMDEFTSIIDEMKAIYDQFVMEYATTEDTIRLKWTQLLEAQEACLEFSNAHLAASTDADRARRKGHVRGLAVTKKAIEDGRNALSTLNPETSGMRMMSFDKILEEQGK